MIEEKKMWKVLGNDRDKSLAADIVKKLHEEFKTDIRITNAGNKEANGQVERVIRTFKSRMNAALLEYPGKMFRKLWLSCVRQNSSTRLAQNYFARCCLWNELPSLRSAWNDSGGVDVGPKTLFAIPTWKFGQWISIRWLNLNIFFALHHLKQWDCCNTTFLWY